MKITYNGIECDVPEWATEQAYKNGYAKGYADGKAEIERLNKEVDRLSQCVLYHDGHIADAIKEFAERLKEKAHIHSCRYGGFLYDITAVETKEIDNIVKEMVGADNEV